MKRRAVEVKVEFQYIRIPILEMLKDGWGLPTYNWGHLANYKASSTSHSHTMTQCVFHLTLDTWLGQMLSAFYVLC